jgi:hypothetical protein
MDKKKVLKITGITNIIIFIVVLINIILVFPPNAENSWIYGTFIIAAGIATYVTGIYLVEGYKYELIGSAVIILSEIFVLVYFGLKFPLLGSWISFYVIIPACTLLLLATIAYLHNRDDLILRKALNFSIMIVSGSFFLFVVEAAFRIPDFFTSNQIPIWGLILIIGGLMVYAFTTWKLFEGGSYIMALTGAFIVNIGVIMIELFYRIHEITRIFTIIFIGPGLVFFLLIFINYKISPHD